MLIKKDREAVIENLKDAGCIEYLKSEDMGIFTALDKENGSEEKLEAQWNFGRELRNEAEETDMSTEKFIQTMDSGKRVSAGSPVHRKMEKLSNEAMRITGLLNRGHHEPEEIREIMEELTGKKIDSTFGMFPPFYTDCGKNLHMGKHVFINSGCQFQDQGGIYIGDGTLIGPSVVLATLNHDLNPEHRADIYPKPIHIGKNVWIGAHATVLPGIKIGDGAVVAAGAVVTKDVQENTVVAGVPARVIKQNI